MNEEYILKIKLEDKEFVVSVNGVTTRVGSLKKAFDEGKKGAEGLSDALKDTSKKNEKLIKDSGLAGATLTEFGRTISDLPFGIQGVANNLSQLSTLFITLVTKSKEGGSTLDGFRKALGRLGKQIFGPLGIILAFQAVIALLDFFSRRTKKAEEDITSFNDALSKNILISQQFQELLDESNLSLAERERRLLAASNRHSQLQKILADETLTQKERNDRAEEFLRLENNRLLLTKQSQTAEELLFIERDKLTKIQTDLNTATDEQNKLSKIAGDFDESFLTAQDQVILLKRKETEQQDTLNITTKAFINFQEQLAKITKLQNDLLKSNTEEKKDNADATLKQKEAEEAFLMDLKGIQDQARGRQFADIKAREAEEISSFSRRVKNREEFEKERDRIIKESTQEEINLIKNILLVDTLSVDQRIKLRERLAKLTTQEIQVQEDSIAKFLDDLVRISRGVMDFSTFALDSISMNIDAEISAEERKTTLLNNELKKRMLNENLSAQAKKNLNRQIALNELELQEKRDKLAERQFKLQKAISIGQALVTTFEMASRAYNAVLSGPEKFLGISSLLLAKVAAGIATGFGLAQVNAIAKQQFVPSGVRSTSGISSVGGGGASATQDPAFNIVGTGQQFQLAQVIAQRTGEPVRAFVVSGDVRTGLALDRNIINSSKIN